MNGNTALHYSALFNRIESAKILLKASINIEAVNNYNQTAYEIANKHSHFEVAKQIKLQMEGKPLNCIKWLDQYEEDFLSDGMEEDFPDTPSKLERPRPASMMENKFGKKMHCLLIYSIN